MRHYLLFTYIETNNGLQTIKNILEVNATCAFVFKSITMGKEWYLWRFSSAFERTLLSFLSSLLLNLSFFYYFGKTKSTVLSNFHCKMLVLGKNRNTKIREIKSISSWRWNNFSFVSSSLVILDTFHDVEIVWYL